MDRFTFGEPRGRIRARLTGGAPLFPLLVLFGLNSVDELDQAAFAVLLPNIRDAMGLNLTGILTLMALITPVTVAIGVVVAYYADRIRRVRLAAVGAAIWGVFSAATGLAVNVLQLGLARVGATIGKTVNQPTHNSLLSDYYPVTVRASVFAVHGAANPVGQFLGPLIAGFVALAFSWRVPFVLFAFPTLALVIVALRLREPSRGVQDRLALGASAEEAAEEETPPGFGEAWRQLYAVKSLRRCYLALPFVSASAIGMAQLLSLFYADVYGLNEAQRGVVLALDQPFAVLGLLAGAPLAQRLMNRDPELVMRLLAFTALGVAVCIAAVALSPNVGVAIGASLVRASIGAILTPGIYAVFSVAIPARVRSLGFVSAQLWLLPGLLFLPVIGSIGDSAGLRVGILVLIPLYLTGSFILASSGKFLAADIEMARISSMAEREVRKALSVGRPKLLLARGVDVSYDSVQVLFGANIELYPGEVVALLGTNGAGKSTLLKAVSGLVDPTGGAIYFDGVDITHRDAYETSRLGIVQMPGGHSIFPTLTVAEHIQLAGWTVDDAEYLHAKTEEIIRIFPRLRERWNEQAGNLSGGEQQMVGLSMALLARPRLLMIDELSLGLAPALVGQLLDVVRQINAAGTTVLIVEQSVNVALTIADRAYFLEKGAVRFSGPTAELLERGDILRAVFLQGGVAEGVDVRREPAQPKRERVPERRGRVLEIELLSRSFGGVAAVNDVSFAVSENEILGLIGPNGAGKTTIFDLVSGFLPADSGTIRVLGTDVTSWPPERRARAGLGRSFQDARIFPDMTVAENLAVSLERHLRIRDPLSDTLSLPRVAVQEDDIAYTVEELIELMHLGAFRDKFASELSTGSRRIVELAMVIAHDPDVLMLDEPSSGIAQRESEALGPLLERLRSEMGCAMVVIEHDMPLVTGISDRMLALELGRIIAEGTPEAVIANPRVVESYLGGDLATIQRSGTMAITGRPRAARSRSAGTTKATRSAARNPNGSAQE